MYFNYNHRYERIEHLSKAGKAKNFFSAHFTSGENRTRLQFLCNERERYWMVCVCSSRPFVSFLSWQTTFSFFTYISALRNAALILLLTIIKMGRNFFDTYTLHVGYLGPANLRIRVCKRLKINRKVSNYLYRLQNAFGVQVSV